MARPDKSLSQSVSKAEYMKILLNTMKDDIDKISLWKKRNDNKYNFNSFSQIKFFINKNDLRP